MTDLFAYAATVGARRTDPDTSRAAAARSPATRRADCIEVLRIHAKYQDGLTDFELAHIMRRQQTSAGKRRGELRDLGLIAPTDLRRPAPSGSPSIVWKITADGIATANSGSA